MTDLIERLRGIAGFETATNEMNVRQHTCWKAADEIERLRKLNEDWQSAASEAATTAQSVIDALRNERADLKDQIRELHTEIQFLKNQQEVLVTALDRIANMKNRDGVEVEMHRDELRAIAKTALGRK